jgi:hypothetical protein
VTRRENPPAEPAEVLDEENTNETATGRKAVLRGAAPWAARHAAKHAAEQRARAAEPPRPGSARATLRTPSDLEDIKAQVIELHRFVTRAQTLQKNLTTGFIELGAILLDIQTRNLYTAKHYASFDALVERELNIGKLAAAKLARIAAVLRPEAALELGLERALEVVTFIDGK